MPKCFEKFLTSEDGAVTVDWVVLTALVVGLNITVLVLTMKESMVTVSASTAGQIANVEQFMK